MTTISRYMGSFVCDRCGNRELFNILSPPITWKMYRIMDMDINLCPICAKEYNKIFLNFMNEGEKK